MTLTTKQKYGIAGLSIIIAFAAGRFSARSPEIKTEISAQTQLQQDKEKNTHTETTITTVKTPDGTVKTVKQINEISNTRTDTSVVSDIKEKQDIIPPKTNLLNISALVSADMSKGLFQPPSYGVSVSREVLGPITAGGFALTNGVIGISIGLNF